MLRTEFVDNLRLRSTEMQLGFALLQLLHFEGEKLHIFEPTTQNAWKHRHFDSHHVGITNSMKLRSTGGGVVHRV
jgi:hypothetical protein